MKLSEIINSILGKNPNAEYDFTISEKQEPSPGSKVEPTKSETTETQHNEEQAGLEQKWLEKFGEQEKINESLRNEIQNLKTLNSALLMRTSVNNETQKSDAELIYELCVGKVPEGATAASLEGG